MVTTPVERITDASSASGFAIRAGAAVASRNTTSLASSTIGAGQTFSHTFASTGTFSYHCTIHTYMIGKIIDPGISDGRMKEGPRQIVGVVGDVRRRNVQKGVTPMYYLPFKQCVATSPAVVLRTSVPPQTLIPMLRDAVAQVDSNVPIYRAQTMGDYFATATATPRFQMVLLTAFAGIALLLSAIGLYAMLSYMVTQRTTEIGVRMAVGAERGAVLRLILRKGVALAGIGLGVGLIASLGLTRVLEGMLYGVKPFDLLTFVAVIALLMSVGVVASAAPAIRAARMDPMRTLREQ